MEYHERIAEAERILLSRIENDGYLDIREENQFFARAGDELGFAYDEALQVLDRVLQEQGAVRERTALDQFRQAVRAMLEDQYLDRQEMQEAYRLGQELGLHRAGDPEYIDRLLREEQRQAGALTEDVARLRLARYQQPRARFNLLSRQALQEAVDELLHEYNLEENPQTRPQLEALAVDVARANGLRLVRSLTPFVGLVLFLLGAVVVGLFVFFAVTFFTR